jgi:ADP-heptose:LPS heptosyltransferase
VQPFSRDSYKDHPDIIPFIERLSETYDVIIFHHAPAGFPEGPGIATTAGLPLGESLALVSSVSVMLAVDSAFIHASAAFDVPLVGLFGPTDGKLFTKHHRRKAVLDGGGRFACAPCWRNEDLPCKLTGHVGTSPCIASIDFGSVKAAIESMLRR